MHYRPLHWDLSADGRHIQSYLHAGIGCADRGNDCSGGDGLKDLVVFAKYSYEGENGELLVDTVCTIYYQRTAGFEKDTDFTENYECTEEDTLEALVTKIRAYWGWQT